MLDNERIAANQLWAKKCRERRLAEKEKYDRRSVELLNEIPKSFHEFVVEFCWEHNNDDDDGGYAGTLAIMEDLVAGIKRGNSSV